MNPAAILALLVTLGISDPASGRVVHSAVEPARVELDVSPVPDTKKLAFFITIPDGYIELIQGQGHSVASAIDAMFSAAQSGELLTSSVSGCKTEEWHRPVKTPGQAGLQGYWVLNCGNHRPKTLTVNLFAYLPALRQVSIWLTTGQWQKKQNLTPEHSLLRLEP